MRRLTPRHSALILGGWQDRTFRTLPDAARRPVMDRATRLHQVANRLGIPVIATILSARQHGRLLPALIGADTIDHQSYSAAAATDLIRRLLDAGVTHAVLCGIETHTTVAQTALDLADAGLTVLVAIDACCSGDASLHDLGRARMEGAGIGMTSTDATVYEWLPDLLDPLHAEMTRANR